MNLRAMHERHANYGVVYVFIMLSCCYSMFLINFQLAYAVFRSTFSLWRETITDKYYRMLVNILKTLKIIQNHI